MVHWGHQALLLFLGRVFGVWRLHVVCLFLFGQLHGGRVLTTDYLRKRGCTIMDWCCLCKCNWESVDHLLLHCGEVFRLWSFAFRSFGVLWVLPKRVVNLLVSWRNWLGKHSSNIWNLEPHCVMQIIWRQRTSSIFEDLVLSGISSWLYLQRLVTCVETYF